MHFEIRSFTTRSARALSAAAALFAASAAFAGDPQGPSFDVSIDFELSTIMFTPDYAVPYITFTRPNVSGFTDPKNPDNSVTVASLNGAFDGTTDSTGGGSTSTNYDTVDALKNDLTGDWRIVITDGATRASYSYIFSLDAGNVDPEYLRRINITSPADGSVVNDSPTFEWFLDPSDNPDTDFDFAQAYLINSSSTFFGEPPLDPNATSWTSDPVLPDDYTFYLTMINFGLDSDMVSTTFPVPEERGGNGANISSFGISLTAGAYAFVNDLTILPAPGTIALAGGMGLIALRRRR